MWGGDEEPAAPLTSLLEEIEVRDEAQRRWRLMRRMMKTTHELHLHHPTEKNSSSDI